MHDLNRFQQERALVSVRRAPIDDHNIQGFVLAHSEQLVLMQYVYDFNLDGLMILRISDISEVSRSKTDEFQQGLLEIEDLLRLVPFNYDIDLSSWPAAISGLCKHHPLLIVERELLAEPDMAIGRILDIGEQVVQLKYFTGAANWLEEPDMLPYVDITCCQAGTNYINLYRRHFERTGE